MTFNALYDLWANCGAHKLNILLLRRHRFQPAFDRRDHGVPRQNRAPCFKFDKHLSDVAPVEFQPASFWSLLHTQPDNLPPGLGRRAPSRPAFPPRLEKDSLPVVRPFQAPDPPPSAATCAGLSAWTSSTQRGRPLLFSLRLNSACGMVSSSRRSAITDKSSKSS